MRMRRKRHLEEKLQAVSAVLLCPERPDANPVAAAKQTRYLDFSALFGNTNPVELEVGCGKGQFIATLAQRRPGTNFMALEVCPNVILEGCNKILEQKLSNVRFLNLPAEFLSTFFPPASIERIYLNFSTPYQKNTYAAHRLTHPRYLELYKTALVPGGEIYQKTDDMHFFEFSLEQYTRCGFGLKHISLDLHASGMEDNIVTEYEQRFSEQGLPIYRVEAYKQEKPL